MFDDLLDEELEASEVAEDELAVGIDLGTTNSVVAHAPGGKPAALYDEAGQNLQPSVVAWPPNGELLVGAAARARRVIDAPNTVFSAKRILGMPFGSPDVQRVKGELPYSLVEGPQQEVLVRTRAGELRVPQISAFVLAHLKRIAASNIGKVPTHCVVTVPAHFTDARRAATRQAAELAGMQVLRVLNEPTAAAIAYGQDQETHRRIAVFDLGGGTFDISLLAVRDRIFEVVATGGDPFLGGDDFDQLTAELLAMDFLRQHRIDLRTDPTTKPKLLMAAEQLKIALSDETSVEGTIGEITYGKGGKALGLDFRLERADFEELIAPNVDRAIDTTYSVLSEAGLTPDRVDEIVLVGGSTRVPYVQRRVAEVFGREPRIDINPMEVVALGAALQARSLFDPHSTGPVLLDVTPHALGIMTAGGYTKVLIDKNTPVPAEATEVFTTSRDNQDTVRLMVCQGEANRFEENIPVGELVLEDLPPRRRGDVKISVTFLLDADGILQATARDVDSGISAKTTLSAIGVDEER